VVYPIIYTVSTIQGGAGFLPSTVSGMRTRATTSGSPAPLPLSWLPVLLFSLVKTQAGSHRSHGSHGSHGSHEKNPLSSWKHARNAGNLWEINGNHPKNQHLCLGNQWKSMGNQWKSVEINRKSVFVMFGPCLAWFENETCHEPLWFHGLPDVACFNIQSWQMHVILKLLKHELCL